MPFMENMINVKYYIEKKKKQTQNISKQYYLFLASLSPSWAELDNFICK